MAFDQGLAERIRYLMRDRRAVEEKKMFGGLCFLIRGHMFCGIVGDRLMVRVGPEKYAAYLKEEHVREMDFTGKPMKGFVYVDPEGVDLDEDLDRWVERCLRYASSLPPS